jgi:hypothetical protein
LRDASPAGITWLDPAEAVARRAQTVLAGLGLAGLGLAGLGHDGPGGGSAVFTAWPFAAERLYLARFGYDGFSLFELPGRSD